jgi:putative peptide zinc metalloprotease protein
VDLDAQLRQLAAHEPLGLAPVSGEAFLSPLWYRVAALRPALKVQARIRRHRFRGQVWYVIHEPSSGRFHRFTPAAYQLLGAMDGRRTMDEVWKLALDELGDDTPGQEEVIRLLAQLHSADLLHCEVSPDSAELFERFGRQRRARRKSNWRNPFSIRIPLWDPDRFLIRTLPWLKPLFGWQGAIVYCATLGVAITLAALHWPELTGNLSDRVLTAQNLVVLWLCFPVVKFLHELGHGYAAKAGGGEVHEMGVLFLVFMPIPYVDASAASAFRNKWHRVLVGAAGMLTELFIASLFMVVWVMAEPGWLRAVAFNVMLIAGISTVIFNANPLLRFDGYFILSDLIEIPNLGNRGTQYWRYLAERYLFRMPSAEPPLATPGERRWFLFYTPAALVYRIFVLMAIVLYIAAAWFFIGVVLAIWGAVTMLLLPLGKFIAYLVKLPRAARARRRAIAVSSAAVGLVLVLLALVPVPFRIQTEGVVWLPEEAHVRAGADGFVRAVLAPPGGVVHTGAPLVESHDPAVAAQIRVSTARIRELEAQLDRLLFTERVQAELTRQELMSERAHLAHMRRRAEDLVARSGTSGRLVLDRASDLPGRYYRKGDLFGYVVHDGGGIVRAVISQDDVDLVRSRLVRVDVRLAERQEAVYSAVLLREVPAARDELPSAALSSEGGGRFAADPRDPKGAKSMETTFQLDLALTQPLPSATYGGRVYVRFVLEPETLGQRAYRRLRQVFLTQFHV